MVPNHSFWRVVLRFMLFGTALGAFVLAILPEPPRLAAEAPDKVQHIFAFAALTLLARLAYPKTSLWKLFFSLAGFGALIEIAQAYPPLHRDADLWDLLADIAAIVVVLLVCHPLMRRAAK